MQITRGCFGIGANYNELEVEITCDCDYQVFLLARNIDVVTGMISISTPPSQYRGLGNTGPTDGIGLDCPAQGSANWGAIGLQGGETLRLTREQGRLTVFVTVVTSPGAKVVMVRR
jgi:hypothetical protein